MHQRPRDRALPCRPNHLTSERATGEELRTTLRALNTSFFGGHGSKNRLWLEKSGLRG